AVPVAGHVAGPLTGRTGRTGRRNPAPARSSGPASDGGTPLGPAEPPDLGGPGRLPAAARQGGGKDGPLAAGPPGLGCTGVDGNLLASLLRSARRSASGGHGLPGGPPEKGKPAGLLVGAGWWRQLWPEEAGHPDDVVTCPCKGAGNEPGIQRHAEVER